MFVPAACNAGARPKTKTVSNESNSVNEIAQASSRTSVGRKYSFGASETRTSTPHRLSISSFNRYVCTGKENIFTSSVFKDESFGSQSDHRIYLRRPSSREIAGEHRHDNQQRRYARESQRVGRAYFEKLALQHAQRRPPRRHTQSQPHADQRQAVAQDQSQHGAGLRADRDSNAQLAHSRRDAVGHHAVNADGRERQRQAGEQPQ